MNSMCSEDSKWLVQGLLDSPQYYISGKAFVEIISGNGLFRHVTRNKKSVEKGLPLSHNKKTSVRGTMIHWSIPLPNHEDAS